ncbi:MAG: bifunctional pyr operon transcriptional regulator/uracil phosphoribosyltransferase PyrR [Aeromicrobium sp.]
MAASAGVPHPDEPQSEPSADSPAAESPVPQERTVLDANDIARALTRITHEILERNRGSAGVLLLGIPTRGVHLARRVARRMGEVEGREITAGAIDVTMYRDDLRLKPARALEHTDIPDDIDDKIVVLIDDVLYSGRTIRAALDALNELGRPRAVQLAVLVDRGHRELPIRADFVGKNLPTSLAEKVKVRLDEIDGSDGVAICAVGEGGGRS